MPNVDTFEQLLAAAQYEREGVHRGALLLRRYAPWFEHLGDAIERVVASPLTTTVTQGTDSAANLYAVFVISPAAATEDAKIQVFNADDTDVTLGTTAPMDVITCAAGKVRVVIYVPGDDDNDIFSAGLSFAATTTPTGLTALGTASQPTVWVVYA